MSRLQLFHEQMKDWQIEQVNRYLKGEHIKSSRGTRREREDVTYYMIDVIESECGIHSDGIPVGEIYPSRYKREKKRRERFWKKVNAGKIIDSRRGYDKYRRS